MNHPQHPNIESSLLKNLTSPGSAFAITFLFLVFQYTFKLDFQCPCEPTYNIVLGLCYTIFPPVILFCVLILTSKTATIICLGTWEQTCCKKKCCCNLFSSTGRYICSHIVRNLILSSLWIATVLIDGDVVACFCLTQVNVTSWPDQIPCKRKEEVTFKESNTIKNCQAVSEITGLCILVFIPVVWCLQYMCKGCCVRCCTSCLTPYHNLYKEIYEDEAITLMEETMHNMAKEQAESNYNETTELSDPKDWAEFSKGLITLLDKTPQDPPKQRKASHFTTLTTHLSNLTTHLSNMRAILSTTSGHPSQQD